MKDFVVARSEDGKIFYKGKAMEVAMAIYRIQESADRLYFFDNNQKLNLITSRSKA